MSRITPQMCWPCHSSALQDCTAPLRAISLVSACKCYRRNWNPRTTTLLDFSVQGSKLLKLGESTARCTFCSLNTVFQQGLLIYKDSYVLWKSRFASIRSIHCHLFRSVESCSFIRLVSLHPISRSCLVTG